MGNEIGAANPELAAEQHKAELAEALGRELDKYNSDYSKNPDELKRMIESDEKFRANKQETYDKVIEVESEHSN